MARSVSTLVTGALILILARFAAAGGEDPVPGSRRNLLFVPIPTFGTEDSEGASEPDLALPSSFGSPESVRTPEEPIAGTPGFPDVLLTVSPSGEFVDFSRFEAGGFIGFAQYSSSFKARADYVLGLTARVPVPGIPGSWGVFGEAFASHIDRDLPFFYNHRSGSWYGGAAGADYTFFRGEVAYLRAQAGYEYSYWNKVNSLQNGGGLLLGAQLGLFWIKYTQSTSVTITPEIILENNEWIFLGTIGLSFTF